MSESLRKCKACNGTGDKKRRPNPLPALKQQCPDCTGEGMVLDLSVYETACAEGQSFRFVVDIDNNGVDYAINEDTVSQRVFETVLTMAQQTWQPKPKVKVTKKRSSFFSKEEKDGEAGEGNEQTEEG